MGYYSSVYVSTTPAGYARLVKIADETPSEFKLLSSTKQPPIFDDKDESVVFGWGCLKFYDSFPEVMHLRKVLDLADDEDVPWQFFRLGEESGDVESFNNEAFDEEPDIRWIELDVTW